MIKLLLVFLLSFNASAFIGGPGLMSRSAKAPAAAGFNPNNDVAGLMLWLEARYGVLNSSNAAAANGDTVKTWESQGDQDSDIAQSTDSLRPTLVSSPGVSFNSKPVVSFDGVDDFLIRTTNPAAGQIMDGSGTTTFIVWAPRDNNAHFNVPLSGGTSNGQLFFENDEAVANTSVNMMMGSGANVLSAVYAYETKYITTLQYNGASSKHWQNRTLIGTANAGTNGSDGISVGALRTGGEATKLYIAAILIYNGALNSTEIGLVWDYLELTYGI